jgi:hypothetical protein
MKIIFTYLIFLLFFPLLSFGQIKDSSINILQFEVNYSFHAPAGDIADRFGVSSTIGAGLTYKMKSNWTVGIEANYLFGGNVKEDSILNHLKVNIGEIINKYGEYGRISMTQRGFYGGVKVGRLFPIGSPNRNSGILVNVGAGLLQHKIHIENKDNNTPPVLNDYKKGYDRLTNGLALREFIGYQYLGNNKMLNFYAGFEFYQAWTQCRRDFNFDTMQKDNSKRNDYLYGIRVGWILPLYKRTPDTYYYY